MFFNQVQYHHLPMWPAGRPRFQAYPYWWCRDAMRSWPGSIRLGTALPDCDRWIQSCKPALLGLLVPVSGASWTSWSHCFCS